MRKSSQCSSPLGWCSLRGEGQDHPADDEVEEEDGVHDQGLAVGGLAVCQERRGCQGGPGEHGPHHDEADDEADGARARQQHQPAHQHGHGQRHHTVPQHTQALEEGDGASQELRVERDDNGPEPDDDKDLGKLRPPVILAVCRATLQHPGVGTGRNSCTGNTQMEFSQTGAGPQFFFYFIFSSYPQFCTGKENGCGSTELISVHLFPCFEGCESTQKGIKPWTTGLIPF